MLYFYEYMSPISALTVIADENNIKEVRLSKQRFNNGEINGINKKSPVIKQCTDWLDRYFAGDKPSPYELPLSPEGSIFRKRVWEILCEIPYGCVITYGDIAKRIAEERGIKKMSAQAVGGAVGHNPISIIIPCHRVVGNNGNLTGYGGGMPTKIWLLEHEKLDMSKFFVPKKGTAL